MSWQFDSQRPIYTQLVEELVLRMVTGCYGPGSRLPSVRELAGEARVNPNTMQRAMAELEGRGLLRTERTSGRFVTDDLQLLENEKRKLARSHVENFLARMAELGFTTSQAIALAAEKGDDK
ncbi:MAG: GntR family transcriptional regulator [Firmicutes bacterium]|nr:GntR family transcriptional regulator [Bacillota bacterium]